MSEDSASAPEGAVAWKCGDPLEGPRWVFDEADARAIQREDPGLLVWLSDDAEG